MSMALIEVHTIQKTYNPTTTPTHALRGVSFGIEKGEFVAIMGPSGSGKSTLLHVMGLLDRPTGGEYILDGKKLASYSTDDLAEHRNTNIGFVFQMFNLLGRTSVLENVTLPLLYSDVPEDRWHDMAKEVIASVGLSHRLDHTPAQLSGGERQRVAIARALINNPEIIFADEPTGNLDTQSGRAVMEIIERLNREEGKTVILVTHETETAKHARRIIRLRDGEIESDEVVAKRNHANGFTK